MVKVTFHGAAKEVTGSCFLIEGENSKLLVDCGIFQGSKFASEKNYKPLPFACGEIDNVLITHAHLDHTGRLPTLCTQGFEGQIFATRPTLDMTRYLWQDAAEIMDIEYRETGQIPLYSPDQAEKAMSFFKGVEYKEKISLGKGDYAVFHDAGHILGSAFIELVVDGKRLIFSGDVGNRRPPIIKETADLPKEKIDLLVSESTYGGRVHETADDREQSLRQVVTETIKSGGTLMIPAFAIERTQEILYFLNKLVEEGSIPTIPFYLDAPLAIEMTSVFRKYPQYFNDRDQDLQVNTDGLFNFPGLRISKTRKQSKKINHVKGPKVIIAGSGMMSGGRIQFHLQRYLPDPKSTLFIVGYQAKGTLGRKIFNGASEVKIMRSTVPVKANVKAIGAFSAHADQKKLLDWAGDAGDIEKIALTHGEEEQMSVLRKKLDNNLKKTEVLIPKLEQQIKI